MSKFIDDLAEKHIDHLIFLFEKNEKYLKENIQVHFFAFNATGNAALDRDYAKFKQFVDEVTPEYYINSLRVELDDNDLIYRLKEMTRTDMLHYMQMKEFELQRVRPDLVRDYQEFSSQFLNDLL